MKSYLASQHNHWRAASMTGIVQNGVFYLLISALDSSVAGFVLSGLLVILSKRTNRVTKHGLLAEVMTNE